MGFIGKRFNEPGGTGEKLNRLAAAFMSAGGNEEGSDGILKQLMAEQEAAQQRIQQESEQRYRQAQIDHMNQPEGVNLGDGAYGQYDPTTRAFTMLREPTPPKDPLRDHIDLYKQYNPNATPDQLAQMVDRGIGGYQYSDPVLSRKKQDQIDIIGARGAESRRTKSTPSYSNTHPRKAAPKPPAGFILD